jgi:hypothetical protein
LLLGVGAFGALRLSAEVRRTVLGDPQIPTATASAAPADLPAPAEGAAEPIAGGDRATRDASANLAEAAGSAIPATALPKSDRHHPMRRHTKGGGAAAPAASSGVPDDLSHNPYR